MKEIKLSNLENEYKLLKPQLDKFKDSLLTQLENIIESEKIALGFPVQNRTKDWVSISNKIENGRYSVKNSIIEMQDLVGLRIILLFNRDVENVCKLLKENLSIVKQYNTSERLKDDQFGYSSMHFIVSIPQNWLSVPTFKGFDSYNAEIQVRTLSQHTWAEASKELQYKQEDNIPRPLLRSIGRVSALLETVDLEFERLLKERQVYIDGLEDELASNFNQILNVNILEALLDKYLPKDNKEQSDNFSELIEDLKFFQIIDKHGLEKLISKHLQHAIDVDKEIIKKIRSTQTGKTPNFYVNDERRTIKGVFYTFVGLVRTMLDYEFPKTWKEYHQNKPQKYNPF